MSNTYVSVAYNYDEKPKTAYPKQLMRHLFHDLLRVRQGVVVDVGCGRGDQVLALEELGFDVTGLDRDPPLEGLGKHYRCDVTCDPFPIADEFADVVFSKSVIEHIYFNNLAHYMNEMLRILKPGGHLIISTPDWRYCWKTFYDAYTHCTPYTHRALWQLFSVYNLKDIRTYCLVPLPSTWHSRAMRLLSDITCALPFPSRKGKWLRWSRERQVVAYARKG